MTIFIKCLEQWLADIKCVFVKLEQSKNTSTYRRLARAMVRM